MLGEWDVVLLVLHQVPVSVSLAAGGRCDGGCAFASRIITDFKMSDWSE